VVDLVGRRGGGDVRSVSEFPELRGKWGVTKGGLLGDVTKCVRGGERVAESAA